MKRWAMAGLLLALMGIAACGSSSSSTSDEPVIPDVDYVTAAEAVAPVFTTPSVNVAAPGTKAGEPDCQASPTWGCRGYEIAVIFAQNGTGFGSGNIYNNITQAQDVFTGFKGLSDLSTYSFATAFTVPFFGNSATYQYAGNYADTEGTTGGSAISKDSDNTVSVLSTNGRAATATNGLQRQSLKGSYGNTVKVLGLDVATYVDYTDPTYQGTNSAKFVMRMGLGGNANTHEFETLKVIKTNPGLEGGYYLNIVGRGISQGAGNYFLFRIWDENGSETQSDGDYFCAAASDLTATSTAFSTPLTADQVASTGCAPYLSSVAAMTEYTSADLPSEAFDTAIPDNPKEFVMVNPIPTP